jgi:hypothetical protein
MDDAYPWVGQGDEHLERVVGRPIIDDDRLEVDVLLLKDTVQCRP